MKTMSANILGNLIKQVKGKIITESVPINEWESFTGKHYESGKFAYDNAPAEIMKPGDRWNAGYDDTRWFKASVTVPESMDGKKMYLYLDFGGEALVRIDGKIVGAVSMDEGWVERDSILMPKGTAGQTFNIEVEATVNCGKFCDDAMAGAKFLTYTVKYANLSAVDEETEGFWFDLITAYEATENVGDVVIRDRILTALDESLHLIDFDFDNEAFYKSVPAARALFNKLLSEIPDAKQGELYMIGHSHLDVAWLWTTRELVRKTARTFSNNLALMKKYPDFKFTQSQAIVYDYMKKYYPDIFAEVKEMVKSGRWEITGNTWVEADTNLASGESLVRQLLYGREFFKKEFGVSSDVYWLPDCFGFTWAMPQIIKRSGMKYFYTAKLYFNATNKFPYSVFNWKSHSGDEVIACVQQQHYEGEYTGSYIKECWDRTNQKDITGKAIGAFGYGDGGGGCTFNMVERSGRFNKMPGMPKAENRFVGEFFDGMEDHKDELPTFNDEMYYENHRGTFTSQAFIKKNNRRGEFLFRNAEYLNVISKMLIGTDYPAEKLWEGWKLLLTNQFHDILPGTSIHEVVEMTREEYKEMNKLGNSLLGAAVESINKSIDVKKDGIIVWNLNSMPVTGEVTAELPLENMVIKTADGKVCKSVENGKKVSFIAENVNPMGFSLFTAEVGKAENAEVTATKTLLENSKLRVEFDENGQIESIFDKVNDRNALTGKGNVLTISQDKPIHESAWNLELNYQKKMWILDKADSVEVMASNSVKGALRIVRSFNKSKITQDVVLFADADYIDFDTTVDWYETEKVLKAAFPVAVTNTHAAFEIAHGSIDRPTHWNYITDKVRFEVCGHKWADLSESDYGVSVINDCKYGYDIKDSLMRITLMRAPICPDTVGDKGENSFKYRLYPHKGIWSQADTVKNAFQLNQPLLGFYEKCHNGSIQPQSFVSVDKENMVIDAVKPAEDGNGFILRLYESEKKRGSVGVKFNLGKVSKVVECNLMETDETELEVNGNGFNFFVTPHQVRTFRIIVE